MHSSTSREDFLSALSLTSASVQVDGGNSAAHRTIDRELSDEMHKLSLHERETVYHDIHGVSQVIEETPELIDKSIQELRYLLDKLAKTDPRGDSLEVSLKRNPNFAKSRWLCLVFLRKTEFNARLAADGILSHFHAQRVMMGSACLGRRVHYNDHSEQDLAFLNGGVVQLLPRRDSAGRVVLFFSLQHLDMKTVENYRHAMNSIAYIIWKAVIDEETQRKGMVLVFYNVGEFRSSHFFNTSFMARMGQLAPAGPVRLAGMHFCYSSPVYRPFAQVAQHHAPRFERIRARFHEGTHMEIRYTLMTFGIPINYLPTDENGNFSNKWHVSNLEAYRKFEESYKKCPDREIPDIVLIPSRYDVLSDRGNSHHPGNMRLKSLVSDLIEEYNEAETKKDKMNISDKVVQSIRSLSGRFLQDQGGVWHVLTYHEACNRVSRSFRSHRRRGSASSTKKVDKRKLN